jgi:hypothetical protein
MTIPVIEDDFRTVSVSRVTRSSDRSIGRCGNRLIEAELEIDSVVVV